MCEPYQQIDFIQVPLYCHHTKFLLVEELALNDHYSDLHYGRCCIIGKIAVDSTEFSKYYFENIRIQSLDKNYSLPEGAVRIPLVTNKFRGYVPVGKVCEIIGESILYNTKDPSANRTPLTSKDVVDRINVMRSEKLCEDEYKTHLLSTYRPAIIADHIKELQKGAELIERNLEIRMLDDLEFSDDLESYPESLESDWYMFWKDKGEDIVNASWFKLYSEYVVKEEEENQEVTNINPLKGSTQDCIQDETPDNKENCVLNITGNSEVTDVNALKEEENQENTDSNTNKSGEGNCVLKIPENQEFAGNNSSSKEDDEKNSVRTISGNQKVASSNSSKEDDENNGIQTFSEKQVAADIYTTNESKEENWAQEILGAKTWQNLWDEHYLTKYEETYKLYQFVHYQQYCFHRPALIENCEESLAEDVEYEVESINQTKELKALGLPTSFGGKSSKHQRNIPSDKDSESLSEEEFEMSPKCKEKTTKPAPKKKKEHKKKIIPKMILENKSLLKYWYKRFSLFSRFDEGIQLDTESWFSVTPEKVAIHMAERLACDTIIDGFCGSGGNAIQFASKCSRVIAIDIDPEKIKNARHNASIYGVAHKIDFIVGDYLQLCSSLKGDVVFLSPPWGGPEYISAKVYDIEESLVPVGASALAEKSRQISENIVFFLPKNSNREQIKKLAGVGNRVEIEHNYLNTRLVGLTAVYGDWLIDKKNLCQ